MSGSGGVSIARTAIRGENRFYNPPPMRRLQQQEAQLQQRRERQLQEEKRRREEEEMMMKERRAARKASLTCSLESKSRVTRPEECGSPECSESGRAARNPSNLDRFLLHTTPLVPARYFPKTIMREQRTRESECHLYFVLEDLWESFAEWSVYGAGVPLLLNGSDSVVQYYVPYLSGIQLYIDATKPVPRSSLHRRPDEESDPKSLRDSTSSDGSSNHRAERLPRNAPHAVWSQQNFMDMNINNFNELSLKDRSSVASSSIESEIGNPPGRLIFEYLEHDPPFGRVPLANKISILASKFPQLMTSRSCDLSPSSWISVAWYPIYRIPTGPTLQNLDACFLTFHSLSTPSQSTSSVREFNHYSASIKLPLPTFGLGSYKYKVSIWNPGGVQEYHRANSLWQAADDWLKRLQVNHPDYTFFKSHKSQMR